MVNSSQYIADYLTLTFNGGSEVITFTNFEILGDVRYIQPERIEIQRSYSGLSFSLPKKQGESLDFQLRYDTQETRQKVQKIIRLTSVPYTLSVSFAYFIAPFSDFAMGSGDETTNATYEKITATFSDAVIEYPSEFAFDQVGRGLGSIILESIQFRVFRSGNLPVPVSPCMLLSMSDFDVAPFQFSGDNLSEIQVNASASGLIDSITNYPDGTLTGPNSFSEVMTWDGNEYVPSNPPVSLSDAGTYTFSATVDVVTQGENCSFTFTQTHTVNQVGIGFDVIGSTAIG